MSDTNLPAVSAIEGELLGPESHVSGWRCEDKLALVGMTVERVELDAERETMTLHGTKGGAAVKAYLETEGDCCSQTWIESVIEEDALIGRTIIAVEDLELSAPFNGNEKTVHDKYEDSMEFYGFAMRTERGKCVIDYRNSSNGYYGGDIRVRLVPV